MLWDVKSLSIVLGEEDCFCTLLALPVSVITYSMQWLGEVFSLSFFSALCLSVTVNVIHALWIDLLNSWIGALAGEIEPFLFIRWQRSSLLVHPFRGWRKSDDPRILCRKIVHYTKRGQDLHPPWIWSELALSFMQTYLSREIRFDLLLERSISGKLLEFVYVSFLFAENM